VELRGLEPLASCMPYLARLPDIVADLAQIDIQDRPKWRTVGGCCGQDCGQQCGLAAPLLRASIAATR